MKKKKKKIIKEKGKKYTFRFNKEDINFREMKIIKKFYI